MKHFYMNFKSFKTSPSPPNLNEDNCFSISQVDPEKVRPAHLISSFVCDVSVSFSTAKTPRELRMIRMIFT